MDKMLEAEIWTIAETDEGNTVLLRPKGLNRLVPIFIDELETQYLVRGLEKTSAARPLGPDLFVNLLQEVHITLVKLEIYALKDNVFSSRLVLSGRDFPETRPLVMECRPSDGLSLAVRSGCPVLINENLVKKAGIPDDLLPGSGTKAASSVREKENGV